MSNVHFDAKISKKLAKIARRLASKEAITFSVSPSKILYVHNGGLGNDVCQEELLAMFVPFGEVENIIMLPQKPFCFVHFSDESISTTVFERLNGYILKKGKDPSQDVVLYFLFVERAPGHAAALFDKPPGLGIVEDFVDEETERNLLLLMNNDDVAVSEFGSKMKHRRVRHFGYEFRYDINDVDVTDPLPGGLPMSCLPIIHRAKAMELINHCPDQLTINQYQPGQGIPPHIDTQDAFEDGIMSLSLGSQVVMEFRHSDGRHVSVFLPRRSLMVMTGDSRYIWSHGITPRKSDIVTASIGRGLTLQSRGIRTSFTFRKVIFDRKKSTSDLKPNCWTLPQTDTEAEELEKEHVHKVYEDIADHFSGTRYKPWPKVVEFLMDQPPHSLMADVGCGNGKCLGINKTMFEIGCDYSSNLLSICGNRGFQTCVADVTCLPFRSSALDVVLCIAVIHHMATEKRRHKAVSEVVRILRPGGRALIYVWAMEQHLNQVKSKYIKSSRQRRFDTENVSTIVNDDTSGDRDDSLNILNDTSIIDDDTSNSNDKENATESPSNDFSCVMNSSTVPSGSESTVDDREECSAGSSSRRTLKVHVNRTEFQDQDMLVPWQLKGKDGVKAAGVNSSSSIFHRFYHVFKQGELESLCQTVTNCVVRQTYYDQGNWCVVLEKLK